MAMNMKSTGIASSRSGPGQLLVDVDTVDYSDRFFVSDQGMLLTGYNLSGDERVCVQRIDSANACDPLISQRVKQCCGCDMCLSERQPQLAITIPGQYQLEMCGVLEGVKVYGKAIGTGVDVSMINMCCPACQ